MGRKSLSPKEVRERVRVIRSSASLKDAAEIIGIKPENFYDLRKRHPGIAKAMSKKPYKSPSNVININRNSADISFCGTITVFGVPYSVDISINPTNATKDTISA